MSNKKMPKGLAKHSQEEIASLREDYLRCVSKMANKSAVISMKNGTECKGTFQAYHPDGKTILVKDLTTPTEVVEYARLRSSDIVSMSVSMKNKDKKP